MNLVFAIAIYRLLLTSTNNEVFIKEDFNYPNGPLPPFFWSEGCSGVIRNGRLLIDADTVSPRASSVWLNRELSGDVSVEFDVYLLSSSDDANNINLFFMYQDPTGKPLQQTASQRKDGLYKRYHELQGYIITNVTNEDTAAIRYRFRKNPGFKLVMESREKRNFRKDKVHIKLLKKGSHVEYWENEHKIFDQVFNETANRYEKGLFGFRTWHTSMEIDNLLIKKI